MAEAPQEAMKLLKQFEFPRQRWNERYANIWLILQSRPCSRFSCANSLCFAAHIIILQGIDVIRWRKTQASIAVGTDEGTLVFSKDMASQHYLAS